MVIGKDCTLYNTGSSPVLGTNFKTNNMTSTFLKNKAKDFFDGKKAKVLVLQRNLGGDEIAQDEIVTITGRSSRDSISLSVESESGVVISGVWCEQLELVKE